MIETPEGITVYAARREGDRWRPVWYENGERKQCQAASEDRLAASLEKVTVRPAADAPNMLRAGDELITFYLIEVRGHLFVEAPKNRKWRQTVYPQPDPAGLAAGRDGGCADRRGERRAGRRDQPPGADVPCPRRRYWRSSNFRRRVLESGYLAAGWRAADGAGQWTWHSLRHVFCTAALFDWRLDVTDVAKLAGHANHRITWEMYVGTAGTLDRARAATASPAYPPPAAGTPFAGRAGESACSVAAGETR